MSKMAELVADIEDLHNQGHPIYMIARITGAPEFLVNEVVRDIDADDIEEDTHPWQN